MQWIFDNLQILIAGAALVAYWLNNMRQAKEEAARERQEAEAEVEDHFGPDFDFGTPEEATPPRQNTPPPAPPPKPQAGPPPILRPTRAASPPPAVLSAVETEMARQQALQERLRQVREARQTRTTATTTGGAAATQARVTGRTATSPATPASASASLARRLRDRQEIRRAIVLREILGPPPGLH